MRFCGLPRCPSLPSSWTLGLGGSRFLVLDAELEPTRRVLDDRERRPERRDWRRLFGLVVLGARPWATVATTMVAWERATTAGAVRPLLRRSSWPCHSRTHRSVAAAVVRFGDAPGDAGAGGRALEQLERPRDEVDRRDGREPDKRREHKHGDDDGAQLVIPAPPQPPGHPDLWLDAGRVGQQGPCPGFSSA
jgi:hypothetical protein